MTKREMYEAIVNGNITDEVVEMAEAAIEKLDNTNAARRDKQSAKAAENMELFKSALLPALTSEPQTASDLKDVAGVSVQKANALLKAGVAAGLCEVTDVKVAKRGMQKAYYIA